jgi:hypothetical protein
MALGTRLEREGAVLVAGALGPHDVEALRALLDQGAPVRGGARLRDVADLRERLSATGAIGRFAADGLGLGARPVRAILFDKTAANNWALGWHQDRTIVVAARIETEGFGPWSRKRGLQHVEPPFEILEGIITLRVHLDDVGPDNAPLLVALGSHRLGRVPIEEIYPAVDRCGTCMCLARAGDIWIYSTPIIHSSPAAVTPTRRRVLQIDYAAVDLPTGLNWLGV